MGPLNLPLEKITIPANLKREKIAKPENLPLETITKPALTTSEAAHYLNRKTQTLRAWACLGGPIRPIRINGRLAWRVSDVKALLEVPNEAANS